MHKKLHLVRDQVHSMIDALYRLNMEKDLPEFIAKYIFLQNYIINLRLTEEEVSDYLLDGNVMAYMADYQKYALNFEIYLEQLMSEALMNLDHSIDMIRLLRSYYSSIYEIMSKNEIGLSNLKVNSKVCMVGVGSMPLSMLFIHRFSGAQVFGIDKLKETLSSTQKFVDFVTRRSPDRYNPASLTLLAADGAEFDYAKFDVVVLSIHISNKDAVIKRILNTVVDKDKLIIVDRKTLGLSQYFYKNHPIKLTQDDLISGDKITSGVITSQVFSCMCSS